MTEVKRFHCDTCMKTYAGKAAMRKHEASCIYSLVSCSCPTCMHNHRNARVVEGKPEVVVYDFTCRMALVDENLCMRDCGSWSIAPELDENNPHMSPIGWTHKQRRWG